MEDFPGLLAQDFGLRPQGKSAPMSRPRNAGLGSGIPNSARSSLGKASPIFDDRAQSKDGKLFNDVFGGPPKYSESRSGASAPMSDFDYDSIFKELNPKSLPVFDVPVYDDDVFEGLPGLKNAADGSSSVIFDDVFSTRTASSPKHGVQLGAKIDELLGSFGKTDKESRAESVTMDKNSPAFADLLPGFGRGGLASFNRSTSGPGATKKPSSNSDKMAEDPFEILEPHPNHAPSSSEFMEPSEKISKFSSYGTKREENSSVNRGRLNELDPFENLGVLPVSHKNGDEQNPAKTRSTMGEAYHSSKDPADKYPTDHTKSHLERTIQRDNVRDSCESFFEKPSASPAVWSQETDSPSRVKEPSETSDLVWLTVGEIPLFTQITTAPPPSRPPPPKLSQIQKPDIHSFSSPRFRTKVPESSSTSRCQSPREAPSASQIAELEDFAMGRVQSSLHEPEENPFVDDMDATSAAASAAMKEAMDKAEAKFKQMREKEHLKHGRSKEAAAQVDRDAQDAQQRESREKQEREREQREEEEREHRRQQKEMEEREREQRRLEREREIARHAVERATREARERAATEARLKAERAAVEKVAAEARERAERAAVQRAQAEARERAERAAVEAREKEMRARAESRQRAERAAVERAASEARERAAAAAFANMQKNEQRTENDLESFFSSRSNGAPAPKPNSTTDSFFDAQSKSGSEAARRPFAGQTAAMRKASSATNIVDDLSSMFGAGAATSSGEFHEVDGESEDRRKARLHRFQRTQERAANALAEKNQRDLQAQKDQAERHRVAETLDVEIRRWATGKEGNLRALLSTLQYVLWPESGWQPVSLTDLITAAAVKKVYRKATLCIHPDKVQQKGANLQQKYIAEKVFDLLKEAWNKFNSEELF